MGLTPAFWQGRRVLVTGHTGFKGSWLSLWLQALGARVSGYALAPDSTPALFDDAKVAVGMSSALGDLRNLPALNAAVDAAAPDVVFHLAAQPLVRASYADPVGTWATNVMGPVHLLEALRRRGGRPIVVVVTSDKCYENREWLWPYREDEALGGHDPYSSSKAATEIAVASLRRAYPDAFRLATARAGNVIGGGDWAADRLIPDLMRAFSSGVSAAIRNPGAIRPWQHVLDPLCGYLLLAEALESDATSHAEAWNFGPAENDLHNVGDIVERAQALWGSQPQWHSTGGDRPHEAGILRLDSSKARGRLGWQPRWNTHEALRATVDWYRRHQRGEDMAAFTRRQIEQYAAPN
ncbi:MAG TPA: CDP-glucose 4,6-dehydratase [Rhodocyclaceae bacterium]